LLLLLLLAAAGGRCAWQLALSQEIGIMTRRLQWHLKRAAGLLSSAPPEQVRGDWESAGAAAQCNRCPCWLSGVLVSGVPEQPLHIWGRGLA
jgi:hypothetical protein